MRNLHTARLVTITPDAEKLIAYCARVTSPHQQKEDYVGLLKYCIKHKHWSVFEQADMTVEITTTRSVSPQLLRHRSAVFQEFSQRYADPNQQSDNPLPDVYQFLSEKSYRAQDKKNRQNSLEIKNPAQVEAVKKIRERAKWLAMDSQELYKDCLEAGIAKEVARDLLLACQPTRLYMRNNIRNWIHYLDVRTEEGVQLEHRLIALDIKEILRLQLPNIFKAAFND